MGKIASQVRMRDIFNVVLNKEGKLLEAFPGEIEEKVKKNELSDYVGAVLTLAWAKIRERKRILLVSQGTSREEEKNWVLSLIRI